MTLFVGRDIPGTKVKGVTDCGGGAVVKLETRFIRIGARVLPVHVGLVQQLRKFGPPVILCEGESHFIGYLQAIYYRSRYDRSAALIHWCYIELPGRSRKKGWLAAEVKAYYSQILQRFSRVFFVQQGATR